MKRKTIWHYGEHLAVSGFLSQDKHRLLTNVYEGRLDDCEFPKYCDAFNNLFVELSERATVYFLRLVKRSIPAPYDWPVKSLIFYAMQPILEERRKQRTNFKIDAEYAD